MELSQHGFERIYERTRMLPGDVLSVISSEAAIDLGSVDGRRYLLFYSPPDKSTKVAIVSEDRSCLITIWEKDYHFPSGLRRITQRREKEARELFQSFFFARAKEKVLQDGPVRLPTKIGVYVGAQLEYERNGAEVSSTEARTLESVLPVLMPGMIPIARIVEANKKVTDFSIRYRISVFSSDGKNLIWSRFIKHNTVMKRVLQAA